MILILRTSLVVSMLGGVLFYSGYSCGFSENKPCHVRLVCDTMGSMNILVLEV